jgi:hypothetical protein
MTPMPSSHTPAPRRLAAKTLLLVALLGTSLSPLAADPRLAEPLSTAASAATSALKSMLLDVLKPAAKPASAPASAPGAAASAGTSVPVPAPTPAPAPASTATPTPPAPAKEAPEPARAAGSASAPAAAASTAPAPPLSAGTGTPLTGVASACMRTTGLGASCQTSRQLSLIPITLPAGRLGQAYRPRQLVSGGLAPYRFAITEGHKPEGLEFTPSGALGGKSGGPTGSYTFTLDVTDASVPPQSVRQAYTLRVDTPTTARKPAVPVAPKPPAPPPKVPGPPHITTYMLLQEDLDDMFPKAKPPEAAASAASAPEPAEPRRRVRPRAGAQPVAYADKMHTMLEPMLNVDYPTAEFFGAALEARRCAHFAALVTEAAKAAKRPAPPAAELKCPKPALHATDRADHPSNHPPPAAVAAASAASPLVSPTLFADLLPATVKRDLTARAEWPHFLSDAKPVTWGDSDCGCVAPHGTEMTYGIFPFWQAREKESQTIPFNMFERIGYLGAQMVDSGEVVTAGTLDSENADFIRTARRFGTRMDLILHRSEWTYLLSLPNTEEILNRAVRDTMNLVDMPLTDAATRTKRYLLPFWDDPRHLFDGVTLFFENGPTDPAGKEKFRVFYRSFVHKLVAAMQKSGRSYALNIVVPDSQLGDDGAYGFEQLMNFIRLAEMPTNRRVPEGAEHQDFIGFTDITVGVLVLLREPSIESKKALRARIDDTDVIQGHRRIAFLNSVAPVLFHSAGEAGSPAVGVDPAQLDLDLSYFKWQYGGMGFMPLPLMGNDNGRRLIRVFDKNYAPVHTSVSGVCRVVCPHRTAARLTFMGLALTGLVSLSLYTWVCSVRRLGRGFVAFLWVGGIATLCVGMALLACDPQLAALREGNLPLVALLVTAVAVGMYYSLKPRIAPP